MLPFPRFGASNMKRLNVLLIGCWMTATVVANDWPYWRGPEYNGISRETGLIEDWDPEGGAGSHVLWVREDLGSRSTPIVMNGKLYALARADVGTSREGERVVCLDAATGETVWESRFNVYLSDVPDTRVAWSSCVGDPETGRVYALGVCGHFLCLDGETGEIQWKVALHERFGLLSTYGGRTNFPVICDDLVIVSAIVIGWGDMAKPAHRFIGFDKRTGEVVWFESTRLLPYDTTYSSPTVTVIDGQKAFVVGSGDGAVWALQPRTGQKIWNFELSMRGLNVSPLVVGDRVYTGHSEENIVGTAMGTVVAIDAAGEGDITDIGELWRLDETMVGKSSPLLVDDRLIVVDDRAKLYVLDPETGDELERPLRLGTVMRSSPLYADGKLYVCSANGRWQIIAVEPDGLTSLAKGKLLPGDEFHASPICANGRIYMMTTGRLYCLGDPTQPSSSEPPHPEPAEAPVADDPTPAHVQLIPADALLRPGDEQPYRVRLFNARGQLLREATAEAAFSMEEIGGTDSGGTLSADGRLTAGQGHYAAVLTAKVGDLTGVARVRVVPPLPWKFDFEDIAIGANQAGDPPITWVGCRYRHVIREVDGNQVMVKVTTIPKGTRSRCWFGQSDLQDYTITADVRGAIKDGKMPDIGLIAQRYALDLQGANQALQIRSWVPQLRMARTMEFSWQPDTWYRMKFRAESSDGKAVLRGKVWPRDEAEPESWMIEVEDPAPNLNGSPGLFGNAKDAEIMLDNIEVVPNE